jgi:DNA repair protein RadA/Sms
VARTVRTAYTCTECGSSTPRWVGRCPSCEAWNTLVEEVVERSGPPRASGPVTPAVPITEVAAQAGAHKPTGVGELDRVLGGGLVAGSVVLLAGEPGIGKSTLLLGVLARLAADGRVLYVCAEESLEQVRLRAERLGALHPELYLAAETDLGAVRTLIDRTEPRVIVVDSVQTVADPDLAGAAGGVGQVSEVAAQVVRLSLERGIANFLVGQIT